MTSSAGWRVRTPAGSSLTGRPNSQTTLTAHQPKSPKAQPNSPTAEKHPAQQLNDPTAQQPMPNSPPAQQQPQPNSQKQQQPNNSVAQQPNYNLTNYKHFACRYRLGAARRAFALPYARTRSLALLIRFTGGEHAPCSRCTACPRSSALSTNPVQKECALFLFCGFPFVRVVWVKLGAVQQVLTARFCLRKTLHCL